jgi:sec-independent protein translocase protein TatA
MFGFGVWEIAIIVGVVLLVLGPAVIPRLGKRVGDMVTGFRDAAEQLKDSVSESQAADESEEPPKLADGSESSSKSS